ncbi:hypothetical protein HPB51_024737 [Rhipicephalus microplus]|uniref:Uncharacterized protein n=1 Tax=Rhipicephalus microplus TaxID=6941 RepID=A0A9J6EJD2_RHIMP|nr:hypothetical protein HPB51_024737 [Rhipicephalus microplus]
MMASYQAYDGSSQEKSSSEPSGEPLIHSYRLTSADSLAGPCRTTPVSPNAPGSRTQREGSIDVTTPRTISAAPVTASPAATASTRGRPVSGGRVIEYGVFLVSVTSSTLSVTLLQPFVLFHCLVQCKEPRCYNVAMAICPSVLPSMEPCQNFFNYSRGDGDSTRYFARVERSLRIAALRWVAAIPVPSSHQSAVQKAAMLLRGCLKLTMQRNEDVDVIKIVLSAGGLSFPKMPTTTKYGPVRSIVEFNLNAGMAPFFRLTAGRSLYSSDGYMLPITPSYDVVSFSDYLRQLGSSENFEIFVRRCAEVIGEPGMSYAALIKAVKSVHQVVSGLPVTSPLHVELKLSTAYPRTGFWQSLSAMLRKKLELFSISKRTFLVVDDDYFKYMVSRFFSNQFRRRTSPPTCSPIPNVTHGLKDLWLRCYTDVHMLMPFAVEQLYLHEAISQTDVEEMKSIVHGVIQATKKFVLALPREGMASEERLIDKIGKLRVFPYTFASLHDPHQLDQKPSAMARAKEWTTCRMPSCATAAFSCAAATRHAAEAMQEPSGLDNPPGSSDELTLLDQVRLEDRNLPRFTEEVLVRIWCCL